MEDLNIQLELAGNEIHKFESALSHRRKRIAELQANVNSVKSLFAAKGWNRKLFRTFDVRNHGRNFQTLCEEFHEKLVYMYLDTIIPKITDFKHDTLQITNYSYITLILHIMIQYYLSHVSLKILGGSLLRYRRALLNTFQMILLMCILLSGMVADFLFRTIWRVIAVDISLS